MSNRETPASRRVAPPARGGDRLAVRYVAIAEVKVTERNPRTHPRAQIDQIKASITRFGFTNPLLVDEKLRIIAGHGRLQAAQELKLATVPVLEISGLNKNERRALVIADNKIAMNSAWDKELLAEELTALNDADFDMDVLGFDDLELNLLVDNSAGDEELDAGIPPPVNPGSRPGDVWLLGKHRIVCGSCEDPEAVKLALDGAQPVLMVTDPPYGVELDGGWRDRAGFNGRAKGEPGYMMRKTEGHSNTAISGDTRVDWSQAFELVPSIQVAYVWHASAFTGEVLEGMKRIGFTLWQQLIWDKGIGVMTRHHYFFQHEPCWYVRKKNAPFLGKLGSGTTVWQAKSPKRVTGGDGREEKWDHPTQKPIELMRRSIVNHIRKGDVVYEPFLGSGTTLAAAETTGRVCCGLEIDPKFVDVVIQRWEKISGNEARLLGAADFESGVTVPGLTFKAARDRRLEISPKPPAPKKRSQNAKQVKKSA